MRGSRYDKERTIERIKRAQEGEGVRRCLMRPEEPFDGHFLLDYLNALRLQVDRDGRDLDAARAWAKRWRKAAKNYRALAYYLHHMWDRETAVPCQSRQTNQFN